MVRITRSRSIAAVEVSRHHLSNEIDGGLPITTLLNGGQGCNMAQSSVRVGAVTTHHQTRRPRVAVVCGFFDVFSGYQEIGLARALGQIAETTVIASDWVNPIFSDDHLQRVGVKRRYKPGRARMGDIEVIRLEAAHRRAMVWSPQLKSTIEAGQYDLVVQIMPGTVFPAGASAAGAGLKRVVLYGDNAAMYAGLNPFTAAIKYAVFSVTKGALYHFVNKRSMHVYGYTPNTLQRLRWFNAGRSMSVLPLAYDETVFARSSELRKDWRKQREVKVDETVILAAGKILPRKRLDVVIDVAGDLVESGCNVRLALIGLDSSITSRVIAEHARRRLGDAAILEPFQSPQGLNAAFNGADVGVWPTMPAITIQQAMGTGLPVIIPGNDLVGHLLRSEVSGRFLDPYGCLQEELFTALRAEASLSMSERASRRSEALATNLWLSTEKTARRILVESCSIRQGWNGDGNA